MKNAKYLVSLVLGMTILLTSSCEQEAAAIRLTSSERIRIDTLTEQRLDSLVPILDSLCDMRYDSLVQQALDSIIELRRSEEQKLRERLKQQQRQ